MKYEWDELKNEANRKKHGFDFSCAEDFEWADSFVFERSRPQDGERRYVAVGYLYGRICTVIFVSKGQSFRIISLRRANKQEEKAYEEQK